MTVGEGISSLAIYRYALNTNKIGTKLFRPVVLLKALLVFRFLILSTKHKLKSCIP